MSTVKDKSLIRLGEIYCSGSRFDLFVYWSPNRIVGSLPRTQYVVTSIINVTIIRDIIIPIDDRGDIDVIVLNNEDYILGTILVTMDVRFESPPALTSESVVFLFLIPPISVVVVLAAFQVIKSHARKGQSYTGEQNKAGKVLCLDVVKKIFQTTSSVILAVQGYDIDPSTISTRHQNRGFVIDRS
ncbi:MAG TPA: hypothetical protein VJ044_02705 [Candidatus Hodarchaeales archaeon]|nr:hypothetical protein [Candidatus Hodarchaeales archaeon]